MVKRLFAAGLVALLLAIAGYAQPTAAFDKKERGDPIFNPQTGQVVSVYCSDSCGLVDEICCCVGRACLD